MPKNEEKSRIVRLEFIFDKPVTVKEAAESFTKFYKINPILPNQIKLVKDNKLDD